MKIGIILHPYGEDKPAGLGRAIFEITRSLIELDKDNHYVVFLRSRPKTLPQFSGTNWEIQIADYRWLWLDRALWKHPVDICIFNTPIISFFVRPKKSIVIAYDFAYKYFDSGSKLLEWYNWFSLRASDHIISISEFTKKDIIKFFKISPKKISVIYLGLNSICGLRDEYIKLPERFFFFVGAIKERKNVLGIVKGFYEFKQTHHTQHKLVIAGNGDGDYYNKILSFIKIHNIESDIIFLGHINDVQLAYIYKYAEALVYPSFIEGFGFPVLEAMYCGCPVITSSESSLPEVAGDAAIIVNPNNNDELANAMKSISENTEFRNGLIEKGAQQVKKFSWEETGKRLLFIINSIYNH